MQPYTECSSGAIWDYSRWKCIRNIHSSNHVLSCCKLPLHAISRTVCSVSSLNNGAVTIQYSTVQYSTIQHSTVQYSTIQHSTVQYSTVLSGECRYWSDSHYRLSELCSDLLLQFVDMNVCIYLYTYVCTFVCIYIITLLNAIR